MFRRLLKLVIMIKNYTNAKSSIPNTLAKVVLELEQQKTGHINFFQANASYSLQRELRKTLTERHYFVRNKTNVNS